MFTGIFGHKKQIEILTKAIESGKIAHAYVFSGPAFVGKRSIAEAFALGLLQTEKKEFHPDLLQISKEEAIKIEEIRDLVFKLSLKPYQAQYKVAIIDNAQELTIEAQNALLKALEEPKPYTIIILVTSNVGKLLRTIVSRAQKINFGPVKPEEYEKIIPVNIPTGGRPGLAKAISVDNALFEKIQEIEKTFSVIQSNNLAEKLKLAYDLADLETVDLKQVLDFWLIKFEQILSQNPKLSNARNINFVNASRRYLDMNLNSKLLLTNLMLNLK